MRKPAEGRPLDAYDISFERIPVNALGSRGTPYTRWIATGMPKLGRYAPILKAVVFLYPDIESAKNGVKAGGTGFLLSVPFKLNPRYLHVHVVTNYHVALGSKRGEKKVPPSPVVRVNTLTGEAESFDLDPGEWIFAPRGPDIAISPPLDLNDNIHGAAWVVGQFE